MTIPFRLQLTCILFSLVTLLFVSQQISWLSFLHLSTDNTPFYGALFLLSGIGIVLILKKSAPQHASFTRSVLRFFFPGILLFSFGYAISSNFHFLVPLGIGLYVIVAFGYLVFSLVQKGSLGQVTTKMPVFENAVFRKKHGNFSLASVFFATLLFFSFGLFHLAQFAAVDEPLWMDGRITRFWKNLAERDFEKTDVSDKPGITLAIASGPGLFFVTPKDYRDTRFIFNAKDASLDIQDLYFAFRLPLLIVITLFLPLFYFFLVPLLGSTGALFGYFTIALSPVLIGMSKIVNPDSLLWLFAPLSFLTYLVFLEKKTLRTLVFSGIFLGLALLTKYVANFLIVFFFGYIFLRYITQKNNLPFREYFKQSFLTFLVWLGIGLATLYLLLPALWLKPGQLFTSTILSQAFEKVAPLFLVMVSLILLDQYWLRSRLMTGLMDTATRFKREIMQSILGVFGILVLFVVGNSMFGMPVINFMEILASPKSIYQLSDRVVIFLTNFYPLFLGVPSVVLLGAFIALFPRQKSDILSRLILAIVTFILLYSFASAINQVVLINRYQIILYPLIGILSGIGLMTATEFLVSRFSFVRALPHPYSIALGFLLFISVTILAHTPFPLSFSSSLLPRAYTTDIKDMGSGSYEAAEYLNNLPDAKNLAIWTDKRGVCKFFIGTCTDGFDFASLPEGGLDYVVISAGRESRTDRMMRNPYLLNDVGLVRYDTYYEQFQPLWELLINGREAQFVRIFPFDTIDSPIP